MLQAKAATMTVELETGILSLTAHGDHDIAALCDVAARANPKRGFLIVSRILGRHLPALPAAMRGAMEDLAAMIPADLPEPVVVLGMAETATALGQGVFAGYRRRHPATLAYYLQTSRQTVPDALRIASFEEGHSHATTHLVQIGDRAMAAHVRQARSLIIVDDECSTGGTFIAGAEAMLAAMPGLERIETCCITDWSNGSYKQRMPVETGGHALLHGDMTWEPGTASTASRLAASSNTPGTAPATGMKSRTGLKDPEQAIRPAFEPGQGERILVLGEGEHSYEALLFAEEMDAAGAIAAVQCITRSPALPGHAMQSVSHFSDSYGSGAPCYLYNLLAHDPDRVVIMSEVGGSQVADAKAALAALGSDIPVTQMICSYGS
ncbi:phosphoribosyltransferase domain-containing protein [Sphingomonas sp.]|uniref:phosphoribosyltransferase domain-containing protein n=1 Tax=Sphingomonas sp. TaxID=28214 RepID=UPI003D6CD2FF